MVYPRGEEPYFGAIYDEHQIYHGLGHLDHYQNLIRRNQNIFSLVVEIKEEIDIQLEPLNSDRWKIGCPDRYALGYFCDQTDANRLKEVLDQDLDVLNGRISVLILEQDLSVLDLYANHDISIDRFYPESCVNGDSVVLPAMNVQSTLEFLSQS